MTWLSAPCPACSTQLVRPFDLCEHDDPLCDGCCAAEHVEDFATWVGRGWVA